MSDASNFGFGKFVPGFDFLQNLTQSAVKGATKSVPTLPNLGNWIAPTLNLEDLDKRIQELKAVQFWLDQNALALKATIQALEVQRMTLATLKGMNFDMADITNAFKIKPMEPDSAPPQPAAKAEPKPAAPAPAPAPAAAPEPASEAAPAAAAGAPAVDAMQWWGALTQQFQQIANTAIQEVSAQAARGASAIQAVVPTAAAAAKEVAAKARAKPAAKSASKASTKPATKTASKSAKK